MHHRIFLRTADKELRSVYRTRQSWCAEVTGVLGFPCIVSMDMLGWGQPQNTYSPGS